MATNGNANGNGHNGNGKGANGLSKLEMQWKSDPRWEGVTRPYTAGDIERLRGSLHIEHSLARAERLWTLLHGQSYVQALGAVTGNQAVQQVKAGLPAIYISGWQVAADANAAAQTYPDQSLYPAEYRPESCAPHQSSAPARRSNRSRRGKRRHVLARAYGCRR